MVSSYNLVTKCPVRWTATQEKSIAADFPVDISDESPETFVSRIYQQFMFLPDSIMPLRLLVPAIRRLPQSGPYDTPAEHHLRRILESLLLTPRSSSEKYHTRVSELLVDEDAVPTLEASILWYGAKYVKLDIEDQTNEEEQAMAEEKWKSAWLERLEQREVMVQILLHFLILTLPEPEQHNRPPTPDPQPPTSSPRKRKRKSPPSQGTLSNEAVEDRLESFMDKLCMWQLTGALDDLVGNKARSYPPNAKGKQKAGEERDWMQIFCEDVVEPLFKDRLYVHCGLLRSKVFPSSPFSDTESDTSPSSPKLAAKRVKTSASSSRRQSPFPSQSQGKATEGSLSRSRSLSVTLEEERERSRSVGVGPSNMRKRVLVREVSMTTAFKSKNKTKKFESQQKTTIRKAAEKRDSGDLQKKKELSKGRTLVAATPAKSRIQSNSQILPLSQSQPTSFMQALLEGEDDDDDGWSPDALPETQARGIWDSLDDDLGDMEEIGTPSKPRQGRVLVSDTPTKGR